MFDKLKNAAEGLAAKAEEARTTGADLAESAAEKVKEAVVTEESATTDKPAGSPEKEEAPKAEEAGARTYTVKSGDTLSAIGAKYGVSYQAIAKASGIDNPDLIFPGQVLTIPEK